MFQVNKVNQFTFHFLFCDHNTTTHNELVKNCKHLFLEFPDLDGFDSEVFKELLLNFENVYLGFFSSFFLRQKVFTIFRIKKNVTLFLSLFYKKFMFILSKRNRDKNSEGVFSVFKKILFCSVFKANLCPFM